MEENPNFLGETFIPISEIIIKIDPYTENGGVYFEKVRHYDSEMYSKTAMNKLKKLIQNFDGYRYDEIGYTFKFQGMNSSSVTKIVNEINKITDYADSIVKKYPLKKK